jgi:hypothetical protein
VIIATLAASLFFNFYETSVNPDGAFYLPHARFWELMLGALLACGRPIQLTPLLSNAAALSGMGLIIFGALHGGLAGPSLLVPTLGAALIISANGGWFSGILSRAPVVFIGKASYPLYLWHWPLLYFYRAMPFGHQSAAQIAAVLGLSLVLSALTYLVIERPLSLTKARWVPLTMSSASCAAMMIAITMFSNTVISRSGFPETRAPIDLFSLSPEQARLKSQLMNAFELRYNYGFAKLYGDRPCFRFKETQTLEMFVSNGCLDQQHPGRPNVFLLGDSHAASLSIGLVPTLSARHINFERMTYGWCEPTDDRKDKICDDLNAAAFARIEELKPDVLILDAFWVAASRPDYFHGSSYDASLLAFLFGIKARGAKHIILVGQMPIYFPSLPQRLIEDYVRKGLPVPHRARNAEQDSLDMDDRMSRLPYPAGVEYVSLKKALCGTNGCIVMVGPNIEADVLLWDYGHMTAAGSSFVARTILAPLIAQDLTTVADGWPAE